MNKEIYSLWVGGVKVNDYYLTFKKALSLRKQFILDNYTDVKIRKEVE